MLKRKQKQKKSPASWAISFFLIYHHLKQKMKKLLKQIHGEIEFDCATRRWMLDCQLVMKLRCQVQEW